nr:putative transposase En/Spm [Ipomoea batatas]
MPRSLTRQGNSGSSSRNRGSHREEDPFIHPSMEFLLNVSPELQPLPQDRRNSLGMNSGNNSDPCDPHMVGAQWRMRTPHSSTSTESPMDGPSRANSVSNDSLGTNSPTAASDAGDARNDEQSEVPSERDGLPKITPAVKDGFEPHGANRAVIECIKKYYKKPIISYKEAPLEVREVWFNEFKKKYRWSPEHDAAIRRNFDVKASERLSNALYDVRANKSCPYWITPEVYKGLCELWNKPNYIAKCEKNKRSRNSSQGDDGPSSLHTCGSIPMSEHRRRLVCIYNKEKHGGQEPSPDLLYRETHTRKKTGKYVSTKEQKVMETVEQLKLTQPTMSVSEMWLKAVGGPKKGGQVPGFGNDVAFYFPSVSSHSSQASAHTSSSTTSYETEDLRQRVAKLENTKRLFMVAFEKILGIDYTSIFQSDQEMANTGRHVNDANQSVGVDGDGTGVTATDDGGMMAGVVSGANLRILPWTAGVVFAANLA